MSTYFDSITQVDLQKSFSGMLIIMLLSTVCARALRHFEADKLRETPHDDRSVVAF